jgi:hypothetical protein
MDDDLLNYANGLWSEGPGALSLVVFDGDQSPGTPEGTHFVMQGYPGADEPITLVALNDSGEVSFDCMYGVTPSLDYGIWAQKSGALEFIASGNTQAPGLPDGTRMIWPFYSPRQISSTGSFVFAAQLAGDAVDPYTDGIFSNGGGSLNLIAREGGLAPGVSGGSRFTYINEYSIQINSDGNVAFEAHVGEGVSEKGSIWSNRSGSLKPIASQGDFAPGTNYRFTGPRSPLIGANGSVAFKAGLYGQEGSGVNGTNDSGIWSDGTGTLSLVAREGSQAPGLPAGIKFGNFWAPLSIDSSGNLAFISSVLGSNVSSSNDWAVWTESLGSLDLVAREGEHAPGTEAGAVFSEFRWVTHFLTGRLALLAELRGPGINAANNLGLWVQNPTGELQLILREGDWLEVGHGDSRQIASFDVNLERGINDFGQIAFAASFTDGSAGVFVSNQLAIPEPSFLPTVATTFLGIFANRAGFGRVRKTR